MCYSSYRVGRHGLGHAVRSNDQVDVIGSRKGRKRLPTVIGANIARDALDEGPQPRVKELAALLDTPGCSSSPDRSLTVAVLNPPAGAAGFMATQCNR